MDKVGEDDERDARKSSPQPGRRLRGGKVTCRRETGRKETGCRETGRGSKEYDVVVCLPGAKIEEITERVENVGSGKGGSVLVHVGTNNVEREGTTAIVRKYRNLVRTLKQTRVEQVILSGILPVIGRRGHRYRNCRGMAINMLVEKIASLLSTC